MSQIIDTAVIVFATAGVTMVAADRGTPRRLTVILAVTMCLAQVYGRGDLTYPFATWRMYSTTNAPRSYWRFVVRTADGRAFDYPFSSIAPWSPGPLSGYSMLSPITYRLVATQAECQCRSGDGQLDSLIQNLVKVHARDVGAAIHSFEILEIPATITRTETAAQRRYVWNR